MGARRGGGTGASRALLGVAARGGPPMGQALAANLAVALAAVTLWMLLKGYGLHLAQSQWAGGAVTAVLVTTRDDELGYPRLPLLLSSLCQQLAAPGLLEELLVVTPDRDLEALTEQLVVNDRSLAGTAWERSGCRPPFPVRVIPDSAVLPTPRATLAALTAGKERSERGGRGAGYRLQMLLKLGVSNLVTTPHYLTLDSDVFATRPVKLQDLVRWPRSPAAQARVQPVCIFSILNETIVKCPFGSRN